MADLHLKQKHLNLLEPLTKSLRFLWHFAHPDGSFGGYYGSRSTKFYNPAGILALGEEIPEAKALSFFMSRSIKESRVVTLSSMDEPNLVPMFNSFAWSASLLKKFYGNKESISKDLNLPCNDQNFLKKSFLMLDCLLIEGQNIIP